MNFILSKYKQQDERKKRVGDFFSNLFLPSLAKQRISKINLEIGCGHGHWLISFAEDRDDVMFVGIDLISKRIEKAVLKADKRNLSNVFFYKAEVMEFLMFMPECIKFSNCFLMYPDPWPKKRHHKRRIVQLEFLDLLANRCEVGCKLFFKTDHPAYYDWTLQTFNKSKSWRIENNPWPFESYSYFQNLLPNNRSCSAIKTDST